MPRVISLITTASAAEVPVNSTTYNEQTSGAQRSLKSASANDAAAGSGARTVRVIYYKLAADGTIRGPFSEVVTLNGQTAVPMVATDLALVERIELVTAGSGGVPAGAITLYAAADGTGTAIAQIGAGQPRTCTPSDWAMDSRVATACRPFVAFNPISTAACAAAVRTPEPSACGG